MSAHAEPEIRILVSEAELQQAMNLFLTAMVGLPTLPPLPDDRMDDYLEPGRTLGAFVDGALVGTVDASSGSVVLPGGGRTRHAAVTHIGVLPTHTRRGIVSALVRRQLEDARGRGDVIATLRASEATIYERFGYGIASTSVSVEVDTRRAVLRPDVPAPGPVRLETYPEAWKLLARIYSDHLSSRPGTIERSAFWWTSRQLYARRGPAPAYVAVHGEPGREDGFVRYHPIDTDKWFTSSTRTIVVDDFFASTPEVHADLVRFLLGLDLVDRIVFSALPADDPLPWLLTDHRAARVRSVGDETWLRILDVPRALAERSYLGAGSVRIAVEDPLFEENAGTFEVTSGGAVPTTEAAHLTVGIAALGSLLLGGVRWHQLAAAKRVRVHDPAALETAEGLFTWPHAPFAGTSF
jgi:predicted acetyltransferase